MTITNYEHSVEIRADEGKWLTNGTDYTTAISLPLGSDISVWSETDEYVEEDPITDEEALQIITGQ